MKTPISFMLFFLCSCAAKPSNELAEISDKVIEKGKGVEIRFTPIQKETQ